MRQDTTIGTVVTDLEDELKRLYEAAKTKSEAVLADVHQEALLLETKVKQEIVILRQRAANLATDADIEAEKAIIYAKEFLGKVIDFIQHVEGKLGGYSRVKDYDTAEKFEDKPEADEKADKNVKSAKR
jgi:dsDNA-specific endonuclease/ATPase MutS2